MAYNPNAPYAPNFPAGGDKSAFAPPPEMNVGFQPHAMPQPTAHYQPQPQHQYQPQPQPPQYQPQQPPPQYQPQPPPQGYPYPSPPNSGVPGYHPVPTGPIVSQPAAVGDPVNISLVKMLTFGTDYTLGYQRNPQLSTGNPLEKKETYSLHLSTIHLAGLHLLLAMSVFFASVYLEVQFLAEQNCHAYYTMIYIRSVFWIITCAMDILITRRHNDLRRQGYHEFYRQNILTYKDAPLIIVTLWNMILFFGQTVMMQKYETEFSLHCQSSIQSPSTYVCVFCGLETILLMIVHGAYIMKVYQFNNMHSLPDALRDMEQPFIGSLGVSVDNGKVVDLLEKQADLIYYLKEQNFNLKRKLMELNQRTNQFGSYQKI